MGLKGCNICFGTIASTYHIDGKCPIQGRCISCKIAAPWEPPFTDDFIAFNNHRFACSTRHLPTYKWPELPGLVQASQPTQGSASHANFESAEASTDLLKQGKVAKRPREFVKGEGKKKAKKKQRPQFSRQTMPARFR